MCEECGNATANGSVMHVYYNYTMRPRIQGVGKDDSFTNKLLHVDLYSRCIEFVVMHAREHRVRGEI